MKCVYKTQVTAYAAWLFVSGYGFCARLARGEDWSKPCTRRIADVTHIGVTMGYNTIQVERPVPLWLEKVELEIRQN